VFSKGWFSLATERSPSHHQKRRALRSSRVSHRAYDSVAYDLVKTRLSELKQNFVPGAPEGKACDWFILPRLLTTPTSWFSLVHKRRSHKRNQKKMETFWFLRLRFRRLYDSAYDSVLRFSLERKHSYDSDYDSDSDSVASENQPLSNQPGFRHHLDKIAAKALLYQGNFTKCVSIVGE